MIVFVGNAKAAIPYRDSLRRSASVCSVLFLRSGSEIRAVLAQQRRVPTALGPCFWDWDFDQNNN